MLYNIIMSDFPFDTFRGIQNGDDATLDDVNVQMITFPDGSTQTQAATPSSKVTGIGYEGTTLTLTQSSGISDLTTTIPSSPAFVGTVRHLTSSSGAAASVWGFGGTIFESSPSFYNGTYFTIPSDGQYVFFINVMFYASTNHYARFVLMKGSDKVFRIYEHTEGTSSTQELRAVSGQTVIDCNQGDSFHWSNIDAVESFVWGADGQESGRIATTMGCYKIA